MKYLAITLGLLQWIKFCLYTSYQSALSVVLSQYVFLSILLHGHARGLIERGGRGSEWDVDVQVYIYFCQNRPSLLKLVGNVGDGGMLISAELLDCADVVL